MSLIKPAIACFLSLTLTQFTFSARDLLAADKPSTIEVITESAFTLSYIDPEDKQLKGYAVDLVKAVMDNAGLKYEITSLPWIRAYKKAAKGENILIFPMGRSEEREEKFNWVGEIIPMSYNLYSMTKNLPVTPLSFEQLKKETIAVPRHDLRADYLKNNNFTNLLLTSNNEQTHRLITHGRINYFLSSPLGLTELRKKYNLQPDDIAVLSRRHGRSVPIPGARNSAGQLGDQRALTD